MSAVGLFNCRESATRAGAVPALSPELRRASSRGNSRDYVLREKTFSVSVFLPPACCWQNYLSTITNPGPVCNAGKLLWLSAAYWLSNSHLFTLSALAFVPPGPQLDSGSKVPAAGLSGRGWEGAPRSGPTPRSPRTPRDARSRRRPRKATGYSGAGLWERRAFSLFSH